MGIHSKILFSMRSELRSNSIKFSKHAKKVMTEQYNFSNDKFTKMLSFFSTVEAYDLICPSPSGENSGFACSSVALF